jgi:hypothetical protein
MNEKPKMLGWLWMRWLGVFIAPNHFLVVAGDGRTGLSLSGARHVSASIRVWSSWPLELFVFLLHRTVRWPLTSALWLLSWHCSQLFIVSDDRWRAGSRYSADTPDSLVSYSGARSAETWEWLVCLLAGLVHQIVSGHCPVRHRQHTLSPFAPNKFESWEHLEGGE